MAEKVGHVGGNYQKPACLSPAGNSGVSAGRARRPGLSIGAGGNTSLVKQVLDRQQCQRAYPFLRMVNCAA